jgi:hypothetical protein
MNTITNADYIGDIYQIRYLTSSGLHTFGPKCKSWACAVLSVPVLDGAMVDAMVVNGVPSPVANPVSAIAYRGEHAAAARATVAAAIEAEAAGHVPSFDESFDHVKAAMLRMVRGER